jgi:hypothetical protein
MKNWTIKFVIALFVLTLGSVGVRAQGGASINNNDDPEAADGLDLYAVAELLKDSENLEKFEQALNSPENEINNLDLNEDDAVDFISVTEQIKDGTHLVVLQAAIGENDLQDVAVIAFEKESGSEKYNLQIQGDTEIYGDNYYIQPADDNFGGWNIVRSIFRPNYRAYVSPYGFRTAPRWWRTRRPLALNVYRSRTKVFVARRNFVTSKTVRVKTIGKFDYRPRTSMLVTRRTKVTRTKTRAAVGNRNDQPTVVRTKTKVVKRKKN